MSKIQNYKDKLHLKLENVRNKDAARSIESMMELLRKHPNTKLELL